MNCKRNRIFQRQRDPFRRLCNAGTTKVNEGVMPMHHTEMRHSFYRKRKASRDDIIRDHNRCRHIEGTAEIMTSLWMTFLATPFGRDVIARSEHWKYVEHMLPRARRFATQLERDERWTISPIRPGQRSDDPAWATSLYRLGPREWEESDSGL